MTAQLVIAHGATVLAALLLAGCAFGPAGNADPTAPTLVGELLVTRDVTEPGAKVPIGQGQAEAAALAWVAMTDKTVHDLVTRQSSHIVGLIRVADQRTTLAYASGSPEDDWVVMLRGASPTWANVDAMVVIDASTGDVRSGQLVQSN